MSAPAPDVPAPSPAAALGWGAYLASSWTWCIGMFFPVFLVRDYGLWGFVVFAVPNVLGAAAMGWVLRSREQAHRLTTTHAPMIGLFSIVTIAFHAFWLAWLATWVRGLIALPGWAWVVIVVGTIALVFALAAWTRTGPARLAAAAIWAIGAGLLIATFATPPAAPPTADFFSPTNPDVFWLAPVCLFGFAFCPYLDATFLRARSSTSVSGARIAFTVGFGVLFLSMIVLTLRYAGLFIGSLDKDLSTVPDLAPAASPRFKAILGAWLIVHLVAQATFTIEVHYERLDRIATPVRALLLPAVIIALLPVLLQFVNVRIPSLTGMVPNELFYRVFMSCYGLVFPAYVWICMIPTRDGHAGIAGPRGARKLAVLAVACALAAVPYWIGFMQGHEVWLAPGLAALVLARLFVGSGTGGDQAEPLAST